MAVGGTLNVLIALCYVVISALIVQGLVRTSQLTTNPLAVATAAICTTCAVHHGHHAAHLLFAFGHGADAGGLVAVREVFGEWLTVAIGAPLRPACSGRGRRRPLSRPAHPCSCTSSARWSDTASSGDSTPVTGGRSPEASTWSSWIFGSQAG